MNFKEAVAAYSEATSTFLTLANSLSDGEFDTSKDGAWSARQIIHHMADSEAQSYARLRRLVAEPGTQIQGYDEAAWGENETLGYKDLPVKLSLDVISAVRASSLEIIKRLSEDHMENAGIHSESGSYSIKTWLDTYIKHPVDHAAQISMNLP